MSNKPNKKNARRLPQPAGGPEPSIIASNYRPISKNTLVGVVDLTVVKWRFTFRGCLYHRKGDKEWLNFPSREWLDDTGQKHYAALGEFTRSTDWHRFSEAALEAVKLVTGDAPEPRRALIAEAKPKPAQTRQSSYPKKQYRPQKRETTDLPFHNDEVSDLWPDEPPPWER